MKVLLINPPIDNIIDTEMPLLVKQNEGFFPPLGLLYIASYLKRLDFCKVKILDSLAGKAGYKEIERAIRDYRPDIVGISAHTHNLIDVILVSRIVKSVDRNIYVCVGGPHVTAFPRETLNPDSVDIAVLGEGEVTFAQLVEALEKKQNLRKVRGLLFKDKGEVVETEKRENIVDLDRLPFPDRAGLDYKKYYSILGARNIMTTMTSSRGCPYQCIFCSTPKGVYRMRSPQNVVSEMAECVKLGIHEVHFVDDTFNADPLRVLKICEEIAKRKIKIKWSFRGRIDKLDELMLKKLKGAGCYRIHLGVETSTDEGLKRLKKGITVEQIRQVFKWVRNTGMKTVANFLIGCPHEKTKEDVLATINFAKTIDPDFILFNVLMPYSSTELYEEGLRRGVLKRDFWREFAQDPRPDFHPEFWQEWLPKKELLALLRIAYQKFYLRPKFIFRLLKTPQNLTGLFRRFKTGIDIAMMFDSKR